MEDNKTAAKTALDDVKRTFLAWRRTPGSGKAVAHAAHIEAVKRAKVCLAESGSPEDKLEFVKYDRTRMLKEA